MSFTRAIYTRINIPFIQSFTSIMVLYNVLILLWLPISILASHPPNEFACCNEFPVSYYLSIVSEKSAFHPCTSIPIDKKPFFLSIARQRGNVGCCVDVTRDDVLAGWNYALWAYTCFMPDINRVQTGRKTGERDKTRKMDHRRDGCCVS